MNYTDTTMTPADVQALPGQTILEFGADYCGHCQGAQPIIDSALSNLKGVRHIKIEDGKGRPLGRNFKVKLWPTLILLNNGVEVARVVRPEGVAAIEQMMAPAT